MASHHEPLKALAPVDWNDVPQHDLETFMHESFAQGQIVIDSIPSAASAAATPVPDGRARAKTDSAVVYNQHASSLPRDTAAATELSARLRGEWREIKVSPKDNPLDISMYKLAGKDGSGSWFGRRSVHVGLSFEQWETGLRTEFTESMKVSGPPGSGGIRGIGAERHVEHREVVNAGHLDVFQLSAQFPGPTAPRDFITLLLTSDRPHHLARSEDRRRRRPLRQYMVISKPCAHPECPPRQGMIRGHYESVEVIREIPAAALAKGSLSSADLVSGGKRKSATAHGARDDLDEPRAVEWLMATRSDPGGSVPRFLIEKGAPLGIIGDAGKFLDWVAETAVREDVVQIVQTDVSDGVEGAEPSDDAHATARDRSPATQSPSSGMTGEEGAQPPDQGDAAGGLQSQLGIPLRFSGSQDSLPDKRDISEEDQDGNQLQDADADADADGKSDVSSVGSFASAPETPATSATNFPGTSSGSSHSNRTFPPEEPPLEKKNQQELQEHRQKLDHSCALFRHPAQSDRKGSRDKSAAAWLAKLHRKHDKQEDKLRREMRRLDEKREHEERKAAARRKKVEERSERSSLALELELARADRDVALREMEMLRRQVGELQRENTMLVARMGRLEVKAPT